MQTVITKTDYNFKDLKSKYEGKVRDVYTLNSNNIIVIATDRISAFDVIMPRGIKYKGQILNHGIIWRVYNNHFLSLIHI